MAFFKDTSTPDREPAPPPSAAPPRPVERTMTSTAAPTPTTAPTPVASLRTADAHAEPPVALKESFLATDLTIEGKIEGAGHLRIAGRFKGDVQVQGNLNIDSGAHLAGQVRAKHVVIAGELHGNIDGAERVELLQTGVILGDIKVGTLTVAAGSRMRVQVEFGWGDKGAPRSDKPGGNGSAA